jgi:hypothetical protein
MSSPHTPSRDRDGFPRGFAWAKIAIEESHRPRKVVVALFRLRDGRHCVVNVSHADKGMALGKRWIVLRRIYQTGQFLDRRQTPPHTSTDDLGRTLVHSLIPRLRCWVWTWVYEGNTLRAGLSHMHGLRRAYAQHRYVELRGWKAPAAGGPNSKALTPEQRELDREARLTISHEFGHEREQITAAYLAK